MTSGAPPLAPSRWIPALPPPLPLPEAFPLAGIGRRVMALLLDVAFLGGLQCLSSVAAGQLMLSAPPQDPRAFVVSAVGAFFILAVAPILTGFGYFTILHAVGGQTLGKLFLGIRVIADGGGPVSLGHAFLRTVGYLVSLVPLGAGFLWAGLARRQQTWHDALAGTRVVLA